MKKISVLLLVLCLMLLCACTQPCEEHSFGDWITEGEEIVRICEVCKEKEIHTHTYGDWEFQLNDMSHSCIQCGSVETLDLDTELVLKELLPGHWSFSRADLVDSFLYAHQIDKNTINYYLDISEDGSVSFWDEKTLNNGTWTLEEYRADSGIFVITSTYPDGQTLSFGFNFLKEYVFIPVGDYIVYLSQNRDLIPHVIGTYTTVDEDGFHRFTLKDDHTIEGFPGSSWHITPIYTKQFVISVDGQDVIAKSYHFNLNLVLQENGQPVFQNLTISLCPNNYGLSPDELEAENNSYLQKISFRADMGDGKRVYFHNTTKELELMEASFEKYPELLANSWASTTVRPSDGTEFVCTDYSISFTQDGKFSGNIGQSVSGKWTLDSASATGNACVFALDLHCSNGKTMYALLDTVQESLVVTDDGLYTTFALLSEEEQDFLQSGDTAVVGQWRSTTRGYFDESTKTFPTEESSAYTLTVNADGTFSGTLEQEESGTWTYNGYYPDDGHHYHFQYDGANCLQVIVFQPDGTLRVQYEDQVTWYKYTMEKQS